MWKNGLQQRADRPVDQRIDAPLARSLVQTRRDPSHIGVPVPGSARYSAVALSIDRTRTSERRRLRRGRRRGLGAAAATGQAGVLQPLRRRRAARRARSPAATAGTRSAWRCTWATARCSAPSTRTSLRRSRCRRRCEGRPAALAEHLALWPLGRVSDRAHPARDELPALTGNRSARSPRPTWRHLLFGFVLGELERRLNAAPEPSPPEPEADVLEQRPRLARARAVAPSPGSSSRVRVLITGASGFAGGFLARDCASAGDDVVGISRTGAIPDGCGEGRAVDLLRRFGGLRGGRATSPRRSSTTWRR